MSGDTGFYSGAKKILELTKDDPQIETKVVLGVSSIIYFASKLGVTWEDAALVSLHGRKENLMAVIKENKKVFALVSNAEDRYDPDKNDGIWNGRSNSQDRNRTFL